MAEQPKRDERPVLPTRAGEDDPDRWGEHGGEDDDRIRREVPPHHQ